MKQASLDNEFEVEKTTTTVVKYKMIVPLKRCKKCGELKPYTEFSKEKHRNHGLQNVCKVCNKNYRETHKDHIAKYRIKHREEHKEEISNYTREWNFLFYKDKRGCSCGYYNGQGICLICGEFHPMILENHHVLPDDDMTVSLCGSCHRKYQISIKDKHMIAVLNAIENSKFLWSDINA